SVYTGSMIRVLERLGSSLLVSTYQTGKLISIRYDRGTVNTHFRDFQRPMGIAVADGRFALGTQGEVIDYRNFAPLAATLEPKGTHDAAFLPRNLHFTGDVAIHEIAFAGEELWIVATGFSCLATLDAAHSFVPRWKPPFVTELASEDRCHLNGVAIVDDRPRYVTALGETNEAGGWRENKASGGIVIDVESGKILLRGLSMPHSPRWHDDRLWLLESGRGSLAAADLESGEVETVAELPGFTRGLAFSGDLAFVGLSQIRETATFGGLPIENLDERLCGVWVVNVATGNTVGFLRFEELVQEIFEVALLPGVRFPEIAEIGSPGARSTFVVPTPVGPS
ncbi:MAG: TIGR03032 family protein, partial [Solirubrobacterales bacterium]